MGKSAHEAALAGTQEIGLAVLATTLVDRRRVPADRLHGRHRRQVLPRVRPDHRRRGADLDVRQLHARPDAVEHLARPAGARPHAGAPAHASTTARIGRVTGLFERLTESLSHAYQAILRWSLAHKLATLGDRARHLRRQLLHHPGARRRVHPEGRLLRDAAQLLHAGRLVDRGDRGARAADRRGAARVARGALHGDDDQQRPGRRQDLRRGLRAAASTARTAGAASTS